MLINFQTFFTVTPGVLIKKANIKKEKKIKYLGILTLV